MTILLGIVATVCLFTMALFLPSAAARPLSIGAIVGTWSYARMDQPLLDRHLSEGGRKEPAWKAALIALGFLVAQLILLSVVLFAGPELDIPD